MSPCSREPWGRRHGGARVPTQQARRGRRTVALLRELQGLAHGELRGVPGRAATGVRPLPVAAATADVHQRGDLPVTLGMPEAFLEEPDEQGRAVVRVERQLDVAPEVAWSLITNRDVLATWFPCEVEVAGDAWVPGAALTFRFGEEAGHL